MSMGLMPYVGQYYGNAANAYGRMQQRIKPPQKTIGGGIQNAVGGGLTGMQLGPTVAKGLGLGAAGAAGAGAGLGAMGGGAAGAAAGMGAGVVAGDAALMGAGTALAEGTVAGAGAGPWGAAIGAAIGLAAYYLS